MRHSFTITLSADDSRFSREEAEYVLDNLIAQGSYKLPFMALPPLVATIGDEDEELDVEVEW